MRLLRRNTTEFEYLPNRGTGDDLDENGLHTGDYSFAYGTPVSMRGNISTPSGQASAQFYGLETLYTHTLVMDKPDTGIEEGGVIRWKGALYDVLAVRPSINATSIALRKQTVNHAGVSGT